MADMSAAISWARAEWRRRWRSLIALGIGIGLAGAVVLAAVAGAERTGSAYDRLVARTARYDVQVQDDAEGAPLLAKLADLPGVVAYDRLIVTFQALARNGDTAIDNLVMVAGEHDGFGRRFDRPVMESGRMPDPARPSEVLLNDLSAAALDAKVGDRLTVRTMRQEQFFASIFEGQPPDNDERTALTLTVTGIGRLPDDADTNDPAAIVSSRVFATKDVGNFDNVVWVRLAEGQAGVDEFIADVEALPEHSPGEVYFTIASDADERVIDTIAVQRVGLLVFALAAMVVAAVAGGQALSRQLAGSGDDDVLRALGVSRRGRVTAMVLPYLAVAAVAALVAGIGAVASSPLLPVGFAGRIEPDPGMYVYPAIIAVGVAALAAFVLVVVVGSALYRTRRGARVREAGDRPSIVATAAAAAGAGPSVVSGLRLALEPGRGRLRLPVRSTVGAVILGAAGVAAVLTFGASLDKLLNEPELHGRPWSAAIPAGEDEESVDQIKKLLPEAPDVTAATVADQRAVTINDEELTALAFTPVHGQIDLPYLEGRPPEAANEIALGPDALSRIDADVGDEVSALGLQGRPVRLEVVGSPIAAIEEDEYDVFAVMTPAGLSRLERSEGARNVYVRTRGPVEEALAPLADEVEIDVQQLPTSLGNLAEAKGIPTALAEFLALLALAAVTHALVLGIRRRRGEIAVLRVLGFQGRQVVGLVAVQATAVALLGALIGIPLGVAAGRFVWSQFASGLNVVVRADVPMPAIVAVGVAGVVFANLIGLARALPARRLRPADVLRTE
jgi:ABC-type lipoprotein release transport system permease subunit